MTNVIADILANTLSISATILLPAHADVEPQVKHALAFTARRRMPRVLAATTAAVSRDGARRHDARRMIFVS